MEEDDLPPGADGLGGDDREEGGAAEHDDRPSQRIGRKQHPGQHRQEGRRECGDQRQGTQGDEGETGGAKPDHPFALVRGRLRGPGGGDRKDDREDDLGDHDDEHALREQPHQPPAMGMTRSDLAEQDREIIAPDQQSGDQRHPGGLLAKRHGDSPLADDVSYTKHNVKDLEHYVLE
jgi:hypothetical protein